MSNIQTLQEKDLYWLAGILEGEAYFGKQTINTSPGIAVEMTDEDIIQRVCLIFNTKYCKPKVRQPTHKQSYKTIIRGQRAIDIMKIIYPIMGERRKNKILECIESYKLKGRGVLKDFQISEIKDRFLKGEKVKEIAKDYPITYWRIYQLVR